MNLEDIGYLDNITVFDVHKKDDEIYHYSREEGLNLFLDYILL